MDNLIDWLPTWNGREGVVVNLRGQDFTVVRTVNGHTLIGAGTTVFATKCSVCSSVVEKGLTDKEIGKGVVPPPTCAAHRGVAGQPTSLQRVLSLVDDKLTIGGRDYQHVETLKGRDGTEYLVMAGECKACGGGLRSAFRAEELKAARYLPHYCPPCRAQRDSEKGPKAEPASPKVAKPATAKGKEVGSVMAVVLRVLEEQPHLDDHAVCVAAADRLPGDQRYKRVKRALASVRKSQLAGSLA